MKNWNWWTADCLDAELDFGQCGGCAELEFGQCGGWSSNWTIFWWTAESGEYSNHLIVR